MSSLPFANFAAERETITLTLKSTSSSFLTFDFGDVVSLKIDGGDRPSNFRVVRSTVTEEEQELELRKVTVAEEDPLRSLANCYQDLEPKVRELLKGWLRPEDITDEAVDKMMMIGIRATRLAAASIVADNMRKIGLDTPDMIEAVLTAKLEFLVAFQDIPVPAKAFHKLIEIENGEISANEKKDKLLAEGLWPT